MRLPDPLTRLTRAPARSGAPVALPGVLDAVSERWWSLTPRLRAVVLAAVVVGALALVGRGATTSPWGPPRPVQVAARDLPAGHLLGLDDVRATTWPSGLVPDDALQHGRLPDDPRLRGPVTAGSVLTRRHLATGLAGLVTDGRVAVPVPVDGLPTVAAGDRVDVVAAATDGSGVRVASGARVLAVEAAHLWLGVPEDRVEPVAAAGATGRLMLAVRPARPPPG